uniref:3-hydroxyacyl-CoA dehydrogenase, FabG4 n=1 Tax=uncultured Nocardioidaceae bacterium TaxID=253824 RepID=A0A6J4LFH3_9ACTN|nr:MAG: 3-hydroxyacyl-CoA dehydrogenase, FabG4 [uncultured Nocardioidaceae bacterium]
MSDLYQGLAQSFVGQLLVKNLGLPDPPSLKRWSEGALLVDGTVLLGGAPGGRLVKPVTSQLDALDADVATEVADGARYAGLVFDATGITDVPGLTGLQEFFTPVMRSLAPNSRVVVLGTPPEATGSDSERIAQRALEGFTRSLGKEVGRGGTVQLVYVAAGAERTLSSTLAFLLSPKSTYVSAQVIRVGMLASGMAPPVFDVERPLTGKVALVTGAARGIGASIAEVLHRDGATIVGVDVPPSTNDLNQVMARLDGTAVTLDITAEDAPARIADRLEKLHEGVDIVVNNAGITRDKKLANMTSDRFSSTLEVNLHAPQRITEELLERKLVRPGGAIIGVASISGIAGNPGQTNYATSKAGVIGFVDALSPRVADQSITVNAVAPGFIETQMTAKMPVVLREAGRRMNSMSQGGLPVDVAETIAWFASPGSVAVSGNVVRVDGQSLLGA